MYFLTAHPFPLVIIEDSAFFLSSGTLLTRSFYLSSSQGKHKHCHFLFTGDPLIPLGLYLLQVKNRISVACIYPVVIFSCFYLFIFF